MCPSSQVWLSFFPFFFLFARNGGSSPSSHLLSLWADGWRREAQIDVNRQGVCVCMCAAHSSEPVYGNESEAAEGPSIRVFGASNRFRYSFGGDSNGYFVF